MSKDIVRKYIKRPLVIEAIQFNGANIEDIRLFAGKKLSAYSATEGKLYISTLEGMMLVSQYDFVVKGIKGEFYPIKQDIFEDSYDELPVQEVRKIEEKYFCSKCNTEYAPSAENKQLMMCNCFQQGVENADTI
jgi:hypothetical protein